MFNCTRHSSPPTKRTTSMFGSKAKKENIQLKQRIYELEQLMASIGAADVVQIDRRRRELEEQQAFLVEQAQQLQTEITSATQRLRSEEHTSELQSRFDLVCRRLLAKKK